jgi:hypothetical protein
MSGFRCLLRFVIEVLRKRSRSCQVGHHDFRRCCECQACVMLSRHCMHHLSIFISGRSQGWPAVAKYEPWTAEHSSWTCCSSRMGRDVRRASDWQHDGIIRFSRLLHVEMTGPRGNIAGGFSCLQRRSFHPKVLQVAGNLILRHPLLDHGLRELQCAVANNMVP